MQNAPKGSIRTKVKMIIFILALHLTLYTLHGICGGPGTTGAAFLKLGAGSRPVAMGEAFVAAADDINALYWNPAGLALADGKQVSFVHTEWFQSIRYEYLAYCQQALGGTIGAGITYLYIDGIERRDAAGVLLSSVSIPANDLAVAAAYSKSLSEKLAVGASVKFINQQLDDQSAMGVAADIGVLFRPSPEGLAVGVALQNLGYQAAFETVASPLPTNLKAGISQKSADGNFTFAADFNYSLLDSIWAAGAGIEYWFHPVFSVRAGYKYNSAINSTLGALSGLTCGVGFKVSMMNIDYALVPYGDLGYTHRITVGAKF